jgi:hypothetical protein
MTEHDHGPRVVACVGCGEERWCGIGPCRRCGTVTPCPQPSDTARRHEDARAARVADTMTLLSHQPKDGEQ